MYLGVQVSGDFGRDLRWGCWRLNKNAIHLSSVKPSIALTRAVVNTVTFLTAQHAETGAVGMEGRKQAVSIRLGAADLRNLKRLSRRLGVRYSDMIRFAVKSTLVRLGPLIDAEATGRNLIPVFLESGGEMVRYLDLDATQLETIINEGADASNRVEHGDIQLLAFSGLPRSYAKLRLASINGKAASAELPHADEDAPVEQSVRRYFYQKYVFEPRPVSRAAGDAESQS